MYADDQFPKETSASPARLAQSVGNNRGGAYGGIRRRQLRRYRQCKQPGHWARECPNAMVAAPRPAPPAAPGAPPPAFAGAKRGREQTSEVQKIFLGGVHSTDADAINLYLQRFSGFNGAIDVELTARSTGHVMLRGPGANRAAHALTVNQGYHDRRSNCKPSGLFAQATPHNDWFCPHDCTKVRNQMSCPSCGLPKPTFEEAARIVEAAAAAPPPPPQAYSAAAAGYQPPPRTTSRRRRRTSRRRRRAPPPPQQRAPPPQPQQRSRPVAAARRRRHLRRRHRRQDEVLPLPSEGGGGAGRLEQQVEITPCAWPGRGRPRREGWGEAVLRGDDRIEGRPRPAAAREGAEAATSVRDDRMPRTRAGRTSTASSRAPTPPPPRNAAPAPATIVLYRRRRSSSRRDGARRTRRRRRSRCSFATRSWSAATVPRRARPPRHLKVTTVLPPPREHAKGDRPPFWAGKTTQNSLGLVAAGRSSQGAGSLEGDRHSRPMSGRAWHRWDDDCVVGGAGGLKAKHELLRPRRRRAAARTARLRAPAGLRGPRGGGDDGRRRPADAGVALVCVEVHRATPAWMMGSGFSKVLLVLLGTRQPSRWGCG